MAYTYLGGFTQNGNGLTTFSQTVTVPAGFVVVMAFVQGAASATVTVNGVLLTQDLFNSASFNSGGSYSGVVGAGSNVTVTGGSSFNDITFAIWSWSGTGAFDTGSEFGQTGSIATTSGDYLFAMASAAGNFTGSTAAPSNAGPGTPYTIVGSNRTIVVADWSIASTNAAFSVSYSVFTQVLAVNYTPSGGAVATVRRIYAPAPILPFSFV